MTGKNIREGLQKMPKFKSIRSFGVMVSRLRLQVRNDDSNAALVSLQNIFACLETPKINLTLIPIFLHELEKKDTYYSIQ